MHRESGSARIGCSPTIAIWLVALGVALCVAGAARAASWDPDHFAKEDIMKLRTVCPGEGEYWFPVWLVVIDRHVFARLGSRAAARIECNTTPTIAVEIAGQKFDNIRAVPSLEMADRVSAAMAEKYWSDLIIRWMPHPMTIRLDP
ncbi:MAG TPA: hypothetical protein VMT89_05160 [Candidatus Acidoferrales bacterium]|nr:hypothetical protein [Candidatus Acidoferrales bacterium]